MSGGRCALIQQQIASVSLLISTPYFLSCDKHLLVFDKDLLAYPLK